MADIVRASYTELAETEPNLRVDRTRVGRWLVAFVELKAVEGQKARQVQRAIDDLKSEMGKGLNENFFGF